MALLSHLTVDESSQALLTIEQAHHGIHLGEAYHAMYSVFRLKSEPDNMLQLSFTTPMNHSNIHMTVIARGADRGLFKFIEAPSGGMLNPTGELEVYNRNLEHDEPPRLRIFYGGTPAVGGKNIIREYLGQNGRTNSSVSLDRTERVLKCSTVYAANIINNSNSAATIFLSWYHHADIISSQVAVQS